MTNLERIRREKNMSQFKLSLRTEIEQSRISNYETMRNNIDNARIETICKFAKALGVEAWEVLNDKIISEMLYNVSRCEEVEHDQWFDGTRIKEMRERLKMTQLELANEMDTAQSTIAKWEIVGIESARIETICFLCIYLDCHPCDLIDDEELRGKLRGVL